ncbi:MAG: hypothetical protein IT436_13260 [Phycisphaerales bacterium]|nr:hypothetical protein [Phycisphaerales bacterium]
MSAPVAAADLTLDSLERRLHLAAPTLTHIDTIALPVSGGVVTLTYAALAAAADEADTDGDPITFQLSGTSGQLFRGGIAVASPAILAPAGPTSHIDIKPGSAFPPISVQAFDGGMVSWPPVFLPLDVPNQAPHASAPLDVPMFQRTSTGQTVALTLDFVISALGLTDPDGDAVGFLVNSDPHHVLPEPDPFLPDPHTVLLGAADAFGPPVFFDPPRTSIALNTSGLPTGPIDLLSGMVVDSRGAQSGPVTLRVNLVNSPTIRNPYVPALGPVAIGQTFIISYDTLIDLAAVSTDAGPDLVLDITSLAPDPLIAPGIAVSQLRKDGTPQLGTFSLRPGESVEWYQGREDLDSTLRAIMTVRARLDASPVQSDLTVSVSLRVVPTEQAGPQGPFAVTPGRVVGISADPVADGELDIFATNDRGHVVGFFQEHDGTPWSRIDLSAEAGFPTVLGDPLLWDDPKDSPRFSYGAALTDAGLQLVTIDIEAATPEAVFTFRNLNVEVPGSPTLTGPLTTFISTEGLVHVAGRTASGDVILFRQTGAGSPGSYLWTAENLSADHLRANGRVAPDLVGPIISYVTTWNGLNIAGLTALGEVWSIWTAPGLPSWESANLSEVTGAPLLRGGLSTYLTSWGGINIAGVDQQNHLTVTWWVPGFGGEWRNSDFTGLFGGETFRPETLTSYVTPWGALNIAGVDHAGNLRIYWWEPSRALDPALNVWTDSLIRPAASGGNFAVNSPISALTTVDQRINLVGADPSGAIILVWWKPEFAGGWTAEAVS